MEEQRCPGCGESWIVFESGSNRHFFRTYECSNAHYWADPYTQEEIDRWQQINSAHSPN